MARPGLDELLRALAHADRREFLRACRDEALSAGELASLSDLSPATVSEHLKVLRKTGLLVLERRGRMWMYRTDTNAVQDALDQALVDVGEEDPAAPALRRPSERD